MRIAGSGSLKHSAKAFDVAAAGELFNLSHGSRSRRACGVRHRPLDEAGPFTFVSAEALTMKVCEGGRVINAVVLLATGVNGDGHREVLGMRVATSETGAAWSSFFANLVARGLGGVRLVTSLPMRMLGLVEAIAAHLPGASWQRCHTHYAANLMSICPKGMGLAVKAMLHSVYDQPDAAAVNAQFE